MITIAFEPGLGLRQDTVASLDRLAAATTCPWLLSSAQGSNTTQHPPKMSSIQFGNSGSPCSTRRLAMVMQNLARIADRHCRPRVAKLEVVKSGE